MNEATLKQNQFTGSSSLMVEINNTTNSHQLMAPLKEIIIVMAMKILQITQNGLCLLV